MTSFRAMFEGCLRMMALRAFMEASPHDSDRKWAEYVALAPDLAGFPNPKRAPAAAASAPTTSPSTVTLRVPSSAAPTDEFHEPVVETSSPTSALATTSTIPTPTASSAASTSVVAPTTAPPVCTGAIDVPLSTALSETDPVVETPTTCSTMGPDHKSDGEDPVAESLTLGNAPMASTVLDSGAPSPSKATLDASSESVAPAVSNTDHGDVSFDFATLTPTTCSVLVRDIEAGDIWVTEVTMLAEGMLPAVPVPAEATLNDWLFRFSVLALRPLPWPSFECIQVWTLWRSEKSLNCTKDPVVAGAPSPSTATPDAELNTMIPTTCSLKGPVVDAYVWDIHFNQLEETGVYQSIRVEPQKSAGREVLSKYSVLGTLEMPQVHHAYFSANELESSSTTTQRSLDSVDVLPRVQDYMVILVELILGTIYGQEMN